MSEGGLGTITYRKHSFACVSSGLRFRSLLVWCASDRLMRRSLLIARGLLVGLHCLCLQLAKANQPSCLRVRFLCSNFLCTARVSKLPSDAVRGACLYRYETGTRVRTAEKGGEGCPLPGQNALEAMSREPQNRTSGLSRCNRSFLSCTSLVRIRSRQGLRSSGLYLRNSEYRMPRGVVHTRNSRCSNSTSKSTGSLRYLMGRVVNCESCRSM